VLGSGRAPMLVLAVRYFGLRHPSSPGSQRAALCVTFATKRQRYLSRRPCVAIPWFGNEPICWLCRTAEDNARFVEFLKSIH
jgi:hypothetical protein